MEENKIKFKEEVEIETRNPLFPNIKSKVTAICKRLPTRIINDITDEPSYRTVIKAMIKDKKDRDKCIGYITISDNIFKEDLYYFEKTLYPNYEIVLDGILILEDKKIRLKYHITEDLGGDTMELSGLGLFREVALDNSNLVVLSTSVTVYKVLSASNHTKITKIKTVP